METTHVGERPSLTVPLRDGSTRCTETVEFLRDFVVVVVVVVIVVTTAASFSVVAGCPAADTRRASDILCGFHDAGRSRYFLTCFKSDTDAPSDIRFFLFTPFLASDGSDELVVVILRFFGEAGTLSVFSFSWSFFQLLERLLTSITDFGTCR